MAVSLAGEAFRVSLRIRQQVAALAVRGDELLSGISGQPEEKPAWATFDDEQPAAGPTTTRDAPGAGPLDTARSDLDHGFDDPVLGDHSAGPPPGRDRNVRPAARTRHEQNGRTSPRKRPAPGPRQVPDLPMSDLSMSDLSMPDPPVADLSLADPPVSDPSAGPAGFGSAGVGPAGFGSAGVGSAGFGEALRGAARPASAGSGPARSAPARSAPARLRPARPGPARATPPRTAAASSASEPSGADQASSVGAESLLALPLSALHRQLPELTEAEIRSLLAAEESGLARAAHLTLLTNRLTTLGPPEQ